MKTYSELLLFDTFEERFEYLALDGVIGKDTFGFDRWLNQYFYKTPEWKKVRREVILRDCGCDLGIPGYEIPSRAIIHHMNPISQKDIIDRVDDILNPEYLICTSHKTHNAIHFGDISLLERNRIIERTPNDTCPWRK